MWMQLRRSRPAGGQTRAGKGSMFGCDFFSLLKRIHLSLLHFRSNNPQALFSQKSTMRAHWFLSLSYTHTHTHIHRERWNTALAPLGIDFGSASLGQPSGSFQFCFQSWNNCSIWNSHSPNPAPTPSSHQLPKHETSQRKDNECFGKTGECFFLNHTGSDSQSSRAHTRVGQNRGKPVLSRNNYWELCTSPSPVSEPSELWDVTKLITGTASSE